MKSFYISFGSAHRLDDYPLQDFLIEIKARNQDEARSIAFHFLGPRWSWFYTKEELSPEYFTGGVFLFIEQELSNHNNLPSDRYIVTQTGKLSFPNMPDIVDMRKQESHVITHRLTTAS